MLEVMLPEGNKRFQLERLEDLKGNAINVAPGSGYVVRMPIDLVSAEFGLILVDIS